MVRMNFAYLFLALHNSYIHLSIFYYIFCHNSMAAWHILSYIMIWALRPMTHMPTKFHWDILKNEGILTTTTTTTTSKIIITRGTVPRGTVDPIPQWVVPLTKDNVSPGHSKSRPLAPFDTYLHVHIYTCRYVYIQMKSLLIYTL